MVYNIRNMDKWSDIFKRWEAGDIPITPRDIKKPYLWRTSAVDRKLNNYYREEFIIDEKLRKRKQNLDIYKSKPMEICSDKHRGKLAIGSMNLPKDTMQVLPTPVKGKNYANMFYFVRNASLEQQRAVWKKVVLEAKKMLKKHPKVFISSQGLGVDYFHVKISTFPKFYGDSALQYDLKKEEKRRLDKNQNQLKTRKRGKRGKRSARRTQKK